MPQLRRLTRRWLVVPLVALTVYAGVVLTRVVDAFAGTPEEEKDCAPLDGHELVLPELPNHAPLVPLIQTRGTVNDASCMNRTPVYGVVRPDSAEEIRALLAFAAEKDLDVSVAGARHSMGGQAFAPGALMLDMTAYRSMEVDETRGTVVVGGGATWRDVLEHLHPRGLSVASMQGVDILTVGGSVSVNAHGTDHRSGSIASTVRSITVMLADGTLVRSDRDHELELFRAVVGGYGLFGVILDVELDLVPNALYAFDQRLIEVEDFPAVYRDEILPDPSVHLAYAHLSTARRGFFEEAILYTYSATDEEVDIPDLGEIGWVRTTRFMLNAAKTGRVGEWAKWAGQKHVLPRFRPCIVQRSAALSESEACLVSRNQALYTSLSALKNKMPADTDILQEYFLPPDEIIDFVDDARRILSTSGLATLNASIRVVHADDIMLSYAPTDRFALVLYVNQKATAEGDAAMADATSRLVDAALARGGTFYLPYQPRYSAEQIAAAYPQVEDFFALKRVYDPDERFTNHFYELFGRRSDE